MMNDRETQSLGYPPGHSLVHCLDHLLARPMFWLSFVFLIAMAGTLHRFAYEKGIFGNGENIAWSSILLFLWPVFIAEGVLRFFMRSRIVPFCARFWTLILTIVLPPTRMGAKAYLDTHLLWLPSLGWNHVDKYLRRRMEKSFSIPMIVIALMVLPFLALEHYYSRMVKQNLALEILLDVGTSVIWSAFALELIVMMSVARRRLQYCITHWIDVAVVLLPLLDFMPLLRTLRLGRLISLQKLGQLGRLYRLRGMLMRAWRAILVLEVLNRLVNSNPERRIRQLRELMAAKEEEIDELRDEIQELELRLAMREQVEVDE